MSKRRLATPLAFALLLCFATSTQAVKKPSPELAPLASHQIAAPASGLSDSHESKSDEVYFYGGPGTLEGSFETQYLSPDAQGWVDKSQADASHWKVSSFNAELLDPVPAENHAIWCGEYFSPCDGEPENPGYGNDWDEFLDWQAVVPDPGSPTTLHLTARLNYDTESTYDFLSLELLWDTDRRTVLEFSGNNKVAGNFVPVDVDEMITVLPEEYGGENVDEIRLRWRFTSDGGWSDEDCILETLGGAQIDKIGVVGDQGGSPFIETYDDFETGSESAWVPSLGCGNARVWAQLEDAGLCPGNSTPQIAFVNDGMCPGIVPTPGVDWTYGPEGNTLLCNRYFEFPGEAMVSPPIELPADWGTYDGMNLEFDAYIHQVTTGSGPFVDWQLRFSDDGGTSFGLWTNFGFLYDTDQTPQYRRYGFDVQPLMPPGTTHVQIWLGAAGVSPQTTCDDATPGPYYDNVAMKLFRHEGPQLRVLIPPDDAFPSSGVLDLVDLASNSVPFQSASSPDAPFVRATMLREASTLVGPIKMHWVLLPNPLFDPYRGASPPNPVEGNFFSSGTDTAMQRPYEQYTFDLPDTGFLFPGDILHFYFEVTDDVSGDQQTVTLPADLSRYGVFEPNTPSFQKAYDPLFSIEALPTLRSATPGDQPEILLWHGRRPSQRLDLQLRNHEVWRLALAQLGYVKGSDYDVIHQNGSDLVATVNQLAGYEIILLDMGRGRNNFGSADEALIQGWSVLGSKKLLISGDRFPGALTGMAGLGSSSGSLLIDGARPYIDGQVSPGIAPAAGSPILLVNRYVADGCEWDTFAPLVPTTGQAILEYLDASGALGGYSVVAGVYNHRPTWDSHVVSLGQDLWALRHQTTKLTSGAALLGEILDFFEAPSGGVPTDVPSRQPFHSWVQPNPFNPRTSVHYRLPDAVDLRVVVYDLRGARVRVLYEGIAEAGEGSLVWDGRDAAGSAVASGLYFVRVESVAGEATHKVALIR